MNRTFKILAIALVAMVGLQSCEKKSQPADQITVSTDNLDLQEPEPLQETAEITPVQEVSTGPTTNVVLSEAMYDFGDIKKGDVKSHTYEVTNTGTNPLIISEVKPGCGCTVPEFTREPIMPGKKGMVTLKFESAAFDGAVQKSAQIFANVEKAPMTIGFTANIK